MSELLERLRSKLASWGWLRPEDRILVAYSGGADSTCLLDLLHRLGRDVVAGHLHHGMRPEADEEMARCQAFCDQRGIPFVGGRADVPAMARSLGIGLEEAGRRARYEFLQRAALRTLSPWIATAHTSDDDVETVLLHLARGAGPKGLEGIPERRGNVLRPMLGVSRAEARAHCEQSGLWFHDDPANDDPRFARSFVRNELLPAFRRLNPSFDAAVRRTAAILAAESRVLEEAAGRAMEAIELPLNGPLRFLTADAEAAFDLSAFRDLPEAIRRRAVRLLVEALGGSADFDQTEAVSKGPSGVTGSVTMEGGTVEVAWDERRLHFRRTDRSGCGSFPLQAPGETESDTFGWAFRVFVERLGSPPTVEPLRAWVPREAVRGELRVRSAEPGDRIAPLGLNGSRKVADVLSEMRLTPLARARLPLVVDEEGVLWVPGGPVSERARIREGTTLCWRLEFGPKGAAKDATPSSPSA
ncbi:MAG: tRNA lysidine(34) synthetase TilS [Fimbriimonadales bacterium]|nr:tRNA lysidine(34) synthetase TilS [Fimbriimonadales bacterium]